jgi:hypothetical protein
MACDPNTLMQDAACITRCLTPGQYPLAMLSALCQIASFSGPWLPLSGGTLTGQLTVNQAGAISTSWIRQAADTQGVSLEMSKRGQLGDINGVVQANTGLFQLRAFGWNGAAFVAAGRMQVNVDPSGDFSGINSGSFYRFQGVLPGTTAETEFARFSSTGLGLFGTQVVGPRNTGWTTFTGVSTKNAGAFDTGTVTTAQLASVVKAIFDALVTHGLIGA